MFYVFTIFNNSHFEKSDLSIFFKNLQRVWTTLLYYYCKIDGPSYPCSTKKKKKKY